MAIPGKSVIGILGALALSATVAGCAEDYSSTAQETPQSGFTRYPAYGHYNDEWGGGINSNFEIFVGIPADIRMTALCYDGGAQGAWNGSPSIVSGQLPPGLDFSYENGAIVGVPTRAGTWHLRIRFVNVTCNGLTYDEQMANWYQDLTIKTSGN